MVDDECGNLVPRVDHSSVATCLARDTDARLGRLDVLCEE